MLLAPNALLCQWRWMCRRNGFSSQKIQTFKQAKIFHCIVKRMAIQHRSSHGVSVLRTLRLHSTAGNESHGATVNCCYYPIQLMDLISFVCMFFCYSRVRANGALCVIGKAIGSTPGEYKELLYEPNLLLSGNGSLLFKKITKDAQGHFLCEAKNNIGAGVSKVIFLKVNGEN